jgi:uncharacterized membrane protein YkgB
LIGGEAATFEYEYDKSDGKTTTMQTHKVWEAARNGWKHKTGDAFNNKPMICIDKVFDVTQGAKQVVAPMFSMVIVIFSIVIGFRNKQMGRLEIVVPLVVIVLSFFLTLSEGWAFALFTMFRRGGHNVHSLGSPGKACLVPGRLLVALLWRGELLLRNPYN